MLKPLESFANVAYVLLRVFTGFMFSFHGVQKIFNVWTERQHEVGSQVWIGGLIEMVGGFLVLIGLQTRIAAFLCSGTMAVAYVQFHWKFQTDKSFFPAINQGELALLYAFVFLYIACRGAVMAGIDKKGS